MPDDARPAKSTVAGDRAATAEATGRPLFDASPDAIVVIDERGIILLANAAVEDVFGYSVEEVTGQPLAMFQPERLREAHQAAMGRYLVTGERTLNWRATGTFGLHRDGHEFPIEVAFTELGNGRFGGFIRDVTARVQVDRALQASEAQYRELLDNANDIVYTHDLQGNFTYVNEAAAHAFGYTVEEVLQINIRQIVDPEHVALAVESITAKLKDNTPTPPYELLTRTRTGEPVWVEVSTRIVRDEDGVPIAVQGIARDTTARKTAQEALARARELRDRVMDTTTNAIAAFDLEGRMTLVNRRMCEMTGYTRAELIGQRLGPMLRPVEANPLIVPPAMSRVLGGESIDNLEFDGARKDGTIITLRAVLRPLYDGDRIVGVIGTAEDITDRLWNDTLLSAQRELLELIAVGAPLDDVLTRIAVKVESQGSGRCSVLLVAEDRQHLLPGAAPSMPPEFVAATHGLPIGPSVGTCGTAAYRGEAVASPDIATDPKWEGARELMAQHGIVSAWSTPILSSGGAVLGTFAVYYAERHAPTAKEEQLVSAVSHIAGIAIERRDAEEAMRRRAAELGELNERLISAHDALAESKERLKEKSRLLEIALASERERARRDPLTAAFNHAAIADEVQRLIQDPATASLALAMIDVDGLKAVNDTWGHQTGDAVLLAVADALRRCGAIVGRYGGDEFVAILPGADRAAAAAYRQEVDAALASVNLRDPETGSRIQIVASVGLAIYPEEADAVEDLIKLSDSAMYAARRQRADISASTAFARIHGGDRAAEIVGEIVPFLTSPGDLNEKLNLVSARLSAGAGYDGVNFSLYPASGASARTASFSGDSDDAAQQYDAESLPEEEAGPVRTALEATRRPIIIDSIEESDFATPAQKEILAKVGLRSALIAPMIWRGNVLGAISVGSKRDAAFGPRDAQFLTAIATQVTAIVRTAALVDDLQAASNRLQQAHTGTVMMLAAAAEAHDNSTGRHLHRVRTIAQLLALEIGHSEEKVKEVGLAAVLHDIGKIRVPDYVLGSTASLSDGEWSLMKDHTIWGGEFLLARGGFELAAQVARSHHERWDGSGYPDGLLGEQIPEPAAITSVADSLDAIISDRPYRAGRPLADAIEEIRAWSGRQFNPHIVDALVRLYERGELPDMESRLPEEHEGLAA